MDPNDPRLTNLRPWQPGQSGNPSGRTKFGALSRACRQELDKIDEATGLTNAEVIAQKLVKLAVNGNVPASRLLVEVCEGKLVAIKASVTEYRESTPGNAKERLIQKFCASMAVALPADQETKERRESK